MAGALLAYRSQYLFVQLLLPPWGQCKTKGGDGAGQHTSKFKENHFRCNTDAAEMMWKSRRALGAIDVT